MLTTPELELVTVALPRGTALEAQSSPTPLTMQAIFGTGTVKIGSHDERLTQNRMIYMARDVAYSVVPDAGKELVLLIHRVKGQAPRADQIAAADRSRRR